MSFIVGTSLSRGVAATFALGTANQNPFHDRLVTLSVVEAALAVLEQSPLGGCSAGLFQDIGQIRAAGYVDALASLLALLGPATAEADLRCIWKNGARRIRALRIAMQLNGTAEVKPVSPATFSVESHGQATHLVQLAKCRAAVELAVAVSDPSPSRRVDFQAETSRALPQSGLVKTERNLWMRLEWIKGNLDWLLYQMRFPLLLRGQTQYPIDTDL